MSKCIIIPFLPEFESRMLSGEKTATTRTKKYGDGGDLFPAFGNSFQLTKVDKVYLQDVASTFYIQEGFKTQQEFCDCWIRLHPRKGYQFDQEVYLHQFKIVGFAAKRCSQGVMELGI